MESQRFKAILFDLDGTLLDSVAIILRAFRETFEEMGIDFDEAAVRREVGIPLRAQAPMFAGDRAQEFAERYIKRYRAYQEEGIRLFPGTVEMLDELRRRGYMTGVVTSKTAKGTALALEKTAIADKFDVIASSDSVVNHKPHPDPILKALELLNLKPEGALYVGDSLFDIDAAKHASVQPAAMSWGARSREDLLLACPDTVFDSWQELLDWLL